MVISQLIAWPISKDNAPLPNTRTLRNEESRHFCSCENTVAQTSLSIPFLEPKSQSVETVSNVLKVSPKLVSSSFQSQDYSLVISNLHQTKENYLKHSPCTQCTTKRFSRLLLATSSHIKPSKRLSCQGGPSKPPTEDQLQPQVIKNENLPKKQVQTIVLKGDLDVINLEVHSNPAQVNVHIQQRIKLDRHQACKQARKQQTKRIPRRPAMRSQGQIPSDIGILESKAFKDKHTCQLRIQKGYLGLLRCANIYPHDLTRHKVTCNCK